jgi:hypothetical protein
VSRGGFDNIFRFAHFFKLKGGRAMMVASTIVLAACAALGGAIQAPPAGQPEYMPLKLGTKWTYDVDAGDGIKNRVVQEVGKSRDGTTIATEHVRATPEGLYRHRVQGIEYEPPVLYMKLPYKEGETWDETTKAGAQTVESKFTAGPVEEVTTPAGNYKAVAIRSKVNVQGNLIEATSWLAEGVGVVKLEMKIGDRTITQELVKFEPAK